MNAKQIIARIGNKCDFRQGKENDGSRYLELGIMTIRISNHKTHLWTWDYNYGAKLPVSMISIVFEDEPSNSQPILKHPVNKPFSVTEYTYQSSELTLVDVDKIIYEINSYKKHYTCPLGIAKPVSIQSQNPVIDIEIGVWDNNASKVRYNNNLLGTVCKDIPSAKKAIISYCNSHPAENNAEIPVYCVVYNCPDTPREILAKYAQCSKAIAAKYGMSNIEPLYESKTIRLNESDLRMIVKECVQTIICEQQSIRRLAEYDVIKGDNEPRSVKGLERYGNDLYDVRMYSSIDKEKGKTYCVFSLGKNSHKYICCRLEYDKEYGTWLGFTPLKNYDVPTLIKQDLKQYPTN